LCLLGYEQKNVIAQHKADAISKREAAYYQRIKLVGINKALARIIHFFLYNIYDFIAISAIQML